MAYLASITKDMNPVIIIAKIDIIDSFAYSHLVILNLAKIKKLKYENENNNY